MPRRLTSFSFTFTLGKRDNGPPDKDILPAVERQLQDLLREQSTTASSSRGTDDCVADSTVDVICMLVCRSSDGKVAMKRVVTEACYSERMTDVLTRLLSRSQTICSQQKNQQEGQLFLADSDELRSYKELRCDRFGRRNIFELMTRLNCQGADRLHVVFDMCGFMEKPLSQGAQWTVKIDNDHYVGL